MPEILDQGACPSGTGLSPTVEPVPVSPPDGASIPSADDPANDPAYRIGLVRNGIERTLATLLQHRSTSRDPKANGFSFAEVPDWVLRQWHEHLCIAAQAMSARQGHDRHGRGGDSPASAVGNADAPEPSSPSHKDTEHGA